MKSELFIIILILAFIGGAIEFLSSRIETSTLDQNNVSIVEGKQIIEINAKGGYAPRTSNAQANIPTTLKISTLGTFDCSSSLVIPSIGYRANLPPSGETLVELPPQAQGSTLRGVCGMGMYSFSIGFN